MRSCSPSLKRTFEDNVRRSIDSGEPVVWTVVMGFVGEAPPVKRVFGEHVRLLVGYDDNAGTVVYTDSWGDGHERKIMSVDDAVAITVSMFSIAPVRK